MRNRKKIAKTEEYTDIITGEIVGGKVTSQSFETSPPFVKVFLENVELLYKLSETENKTFWGIMKKMDYNNEIILIKDKKLEIAKSLDLELNTVEHVITSLVKKNILERKATSIYIANSNLVWRGYFEDKIKFERERDPLNNNSNKEFNNK